MLARHVSASFGMSIWIQNWICSSCACEGKLARPRTSLVPMAKYFSLALSGEGGEVWVMNARAWKLGHTVTDSGDNHFRQAYVSQGPGHSHWGIYALAFKIQVLAFRALALSLMRSRAGTR